VAENYDVIIVGSGAGGGTLAHTLAPSGKRILLLERGNDPRRRSPAEPDGVTVLRRGQCDDGPATEISIPTEKGLKR
jgi:choline dehydrogenase-like flavoprotein